MFKKLAAAALCAALLTVSAYAAADWPDWASRSLGGRAFQRCARGL